MPRVGICLLVGVLALLLTEACGRPSTPAVVKPAPSSVPTPSPSPSPSPAPVTRSPSKPPSVAKTVVQMPREEQFLLHSKLYSAGQVAEVECSLPTTKLATKQALMRYATAFVGCLNKAWAPVIARSDLGFVPPGGVHAAPTGTKSPCGTMEKDTLAFYCDTGWGIYFNWPEYVVKESYLQEGTRAAVQYLMAHEYGHHVQQLSGMAGEYDSRYWAAKGAARQLEEGRNEFQAHCFGAAFFGANRKTLRLHGDRLRHYGYPGFDRSTASDNFLRWLRLGFEARGPAGCNTWAAPAKKVR